MSYSIEITAEDIYGPDYKIPHGYEVERFGFVRKGDLILTAETPPYVYHVQHIWPVGCGPRLILRRKIQRRWLVEEREDSHYGENGVLTFPNSNKPIFVSILKEVTD